MLIKVSMRWKQIFIVYKFLPIMNNKEETQDERTYILNLSLEVLYD